MGIWGWVACSQASIIFALVCLGSLWYHGKHRDKNGKTALAKIAFAGIQGATFYTIVVTVLLHWFVKIPITTTLSEGFGQERFAWLFYGMFIDLLSRLFVMYDPD